MNTMIVSYIGNTYNQSRQSGSRNNKKYLDKHQNSNKKQKNNLETPPFIISDCSGSMSGIYSKYGV